MDVRITKLNEVFVKLRCEHSIGQEISDYFTFLVPGAQFTKEFKNKLWDGKIRLFDRRSNTLYHGLVSYVEKFCKDRDYSFEISKEVNLTEEFSVVEAERFVAALKLPAHIDKRAYQVDAFVRGVRNKRMLLVSPTASGKSLFLYMNLRYLQYKKFKKGLLVVPTTALVEQMYKDFETYGYNSEKHCHRVYEGREKNTDKFLTITTWHSIYKNPPEWFEQFDFVFGDEAHEFKATSLKTIMTSLVNAKFRIGCTGTLDGTKTHKLVLEGLFGPHYQNITTSQLIKAGYASELNIKCLILKHSDDACRLVKQMDYAAEIDYIVSSKARNRFLKNLSLSLKGNTLVLFNLVEKHGKDLYRIIKEEAGNRKVFFVYGKTEVAVREEVRSIVENEIDAIIIASYGTFARGINIRNLHNIIFASPSKSRIRNLQSIGRSLRIGNNKSMAILYDVSDDFRIDKFVNFTLKHFVERVKIYDESKFPYKFYNIELKDE